LEVQKMQKLHEDQVVDAHKLLCPVPVLATIKRLRLAEPGQVMKVLGTERGVLADIPTWPEDTGNQLLARGERRAGLLDPEGER
jgi:tRNA 2-thiouridine synthesizing protein A